jgi:hypothetical protein
MATFPHNLYTYFCRSRTNTPDANGDWRWRFNFTLVSQNPSTNSSTYRIRHYLQLRNQPSGAQERQWCCGNQVNSGAWSNWEYDRYEGTPPFPTPPGDSEHLVWTQNRTITHESDGKKTAYLRGRGGFWQPITFVPKSYTWMYATNTLFEFPTIPRYATINSYNLITASMTSLNVSWSANVTCDRVQYRIGSGSWVTAQTGDRTSGSFSITGLNPGTQYSIKIRVRRKDSQLYTESSAKNATTVDIARITSANDFNDTEKPTINFSNPSGEKIDVFLGYYSGTGIWRYDIPNTGSYEFNLTEEEWNILYDYNKTLSHFTVLYKIVTNDEYEHSVVRYMTIINANPIFNNFTYEDINATTLALTGDDQTIVKNYSNLKATVSLENKAVAQKGANMVKYRLVVGAKQIDVNYDDENAVELTLNAIDNNVFMVYAIDSRNNSTVVQKSPNVYIDYFHPTINNANAERTGGIQAETTLTFNGVFFNASFGLVTNDLTATYKYKKTSDSEWTDGTTTLILTKDGNNYSFEGLIAGDEGANGFDSTFSYDIQVKVEDELSGRTFDFILGTGTPNIAIHRDGISVNAPYDEELGGALQVHGEIKTDSNINGASPTELGYVSGVTSNIQTQLNGKVGKQSYEILNRCFYSSGGIDANTSTYPFFLTHVNTPSSYRYIVQYFYGAPASDGARVQIALPYNSGTTVYTRYMYSGVWSSWSAI